MRRLVFFIVALTLMALAAFGALDAEGRRSLMAGLADPVLGLDHFMVLVGVGLWAGKLSDVARWRLPAAFLSGAFVGFVLAAGQPPFPVVEALVHLLVIGSMLLVAVVLVLPVTLPPREVTTTVAMFGGCHGYLHWLEIGTTEALWFGLGAAVTASVLMTAGAVVALVLPRAG